MLILFVVFLLFFANATKNSNTNQENGDDILFQNVEIENDIEVISSILPGIPLEECSFKRENVGSNDIPGPSETVICGYLKTTEEYLDYLAETYQWIPVLVHTEFELIKNTELHFMSSVDYDKENMSKQDGTRIYVYVDFESKLLFFTGTL